MIIGEFCDVFPPETDGVGVVCRRYTEGLDALGNECWYVAPGGAKEAPVPFRTLLFRSLRIPRMAYRFGFPFFDRSFIKKLDAVAFDVCHAHSPFLAGRIARRVARRRGVPLVATFHSKYYDDFLKETHSRLLARIGVRYVVSFFNQCDAVYTVSRQAAEVLRSYGYQGELRVLPNGTEEWNPSGTAEEYLSTLLGPNYPKEPLFLFVGQQNWKKNIRLILDAFALYREKNGAGRLLLVGQGPDLHAIRTYAGKIGVGDATFFTGQISDRDLLLRIFAAADLFLFPSLYDTFALVVREAAIAGTPSIVAEGSCAAEDVEDGKNGFLCRPDDPEDMEAVIEKALPLAREVGEIARTTLPRPWPEILSEIGSHYVALAEEKKNDLSRKSKRRKRKKKTKGAIVS